MMAWNPSHQTKVQALARMRDRYRAATRIEACKIAWRMLRLLDEGDCTQAQMLNAWNMTAQQWTDKRAQSLQPRADKYLAWLSSTSAIDSEGADGG